jgi:hypothetical protein
LNKFKIPEIVPTIRIVKIVIAKSL